MSSPRYCDDPTPHKSHEWTEYFDRGTSQHYCWGVKTSMFILDAVEARDGVKAHLDRMEDMLQRISVTHRRTEAEFYEGDKH